jgi:hypothetical protein
VIAHVAGVPVEEALLPMLSGLGATLLIAQAWLMTRLRRPKTEDRGGATESG